MNRIKNFFSFYFNMYFNNIDEMATRFHYWSFSLLMFGLILGLKGIEIAFNFNMEQTVNILDIVFMWPIVVLTAKRLNDIVGNSDYMIITIVLSVCMAFLPDWHDVALWLWLVVGLIPSNYFSSVKNRYFRKVKPIH
jgi:uncharacterized membrane protein YhaH (DUF805 family)